MVAISDFSCHVRGRHRSVVELELAEYDRPEPSVCVCREY